MIELIYCSNCTGKGKLEYCKVCQLCNFYAAKGQIKGVVLK